MGHPKLFNPSHIKIGAHPAKIQKSSPILLGLKIMTNAEFYWCLVTRTEGYGLRGPRNILETVSLANQIHHRYLKLNIIKPPFYVYC